MIDGKMPIVALTTGIWLAGCTTSYTPPSVSGLQSTGPFPGAGDVCAVVVANEAETLNLLNQDIEGTSPLSVDNAKVLIDPKVFNADWIFTGGGDSSSFVKISTDELKRVVDYSVEKVSAF